MASPYESYRPEEAGPGVPQYEAYGVAHAQREAPSQQRDLERPIVEKGPEDGSGASVVAQFRDLPFAVVFVLQLLAVVVVAVANGRKVATELPYAGVLSAATLKICAASCVSSALFAVGWLAVLRQHARALIWLSTGGSAVLYLLTSAWLLTGKSSASVLLGLALLASAACHLAFLYAVRDRVSFSATLLSTVASLLHAHPALIALALGAVFATLLWLFVWSIAMSYTLHARALVLGGAAGGAQAAQAYGAQGWCVFWLLLSFYWTAHVVKNVVHVTVAGTVGSWYFLAPQLQGDPTRRSLARALSTSFGSICLGSLVVSAIRALRLAASAASRRAAPGPIRSCLLCALGFLDVLVRFFNQYAFTHVALYGKHFTAASRDTWALLVRCGIDILAQKELTASVLLSGCVAGGLANVLLLGSVARASFAGDAHEWLPVACLVFAIGAGIQLLVSAVVESAVCALYVCYAEDPNALATVHPQLYASFVHANPTVPLPGAPILPAMHGGRTAV